jgi:dephospho-CoA kinase
VLTIGLTGGIASGKSTVAQLLARRGARVVDADRVAHETYAPGTPGFNAVVAAFGPDIAGSNGAIDRRALGRIVFEDPAALERLTDIVWPLIRARVEALRDEALAADTPAFVVEAVALREAGWNDLFDTIWLVRSPKPAVRDRLLARGLTAGEAEARLVAQEVSGLDLQGIDVVIDNGGDLAELERRVDAAWNAVLQRSK